MIVDQYTKFVEAYWRCTAAACDGVAREKATRGFVMRGHQERNRCRRSLVPVRLDEFFNADGASPGLPRVPRPQIPEPMQSESQGSPIPLRPGAAGRSFCQKFRFTVSSAWHSFARLLAGRFAALLIAAVAAGQRCAHGCRQTLVFDQKQPHTDTTQCE